MCHGSSHYDKHRRRSGDETGNADLIRDGLVAFFELTGSRAKAGNTAVVRSQLSHRRGISISTSHYPW